MQSRSWQPKGRVSLLMMFFLIAGLVLGVAFARPALALVDGHGYTENEKIGFAFYQLSGAKPDFKSWVRKTDAYKKALPVEKVELMQSELTRLERGMGLFHPDEDLVTIEMDVSIKRLPDVGTDPEKMKHALQIDFTGNKDQDSYYIPVEIGDIWIAIIVQGMDKQSFRIFDTPQFKSVLQKLNSTLTSQVTTLEGHVKLSLRPVSVSKQSPVRVADIDLWPMLAEIASFSLWSRDSSVFIWGYEAPWYVSNDRKDLVDLYKD